MTQLFQCCFLKVAATSMNIRSVNLYFQPNIKVETTLGHQHWVNVIILLLFQRCIVSVEATSINIRWPNFYFQPNFNVETTLVHGSWIDVILSMLFQRCFANIETTLTNVRRLNFNFQPNINVETALMNVDDQRCFKVYLTWRVCWERSRYYSQFNSFCLYSLKNGLW